MYLKTVVGLIVLLTSSQVSAADDFAQYDRQLPEKYDKVTVKIENSVLNNSYPVNASLDELGNALLDNAPSGHEGYKSLAKLILDIKWQVGMDQDTYMCNLHNITIVNQSEFITPLWNYGDDVSDADAEKWDLFMESVNEFQTRNRLVILKHLEQMKESFEQVQPRATCTELEEEIDKLGNNHLLAAAKEINSLALETNSGRDFKNLEYPDFFSDKPLPKSQEAKPQETKPQESGKNSSGSKTGQKGKKK